MGKIGEIIYGRFKPPITVNQVFSLCSKFDIDVEFTIEAGSHHGTDTVFFLENKNINRIFCFEPNPNSRKIFTQNLKTFPTDKYILFDFGLSDREEAGFLFSPTIDLGSESVSSAGNSSLIRTWGKSNGSGHLIQLRTLDNLFKELRLDSLIPKERKGILWLDVEGSALKALHGMQKTLKHISIAKIELEYGKQPGQWEKKTIFQVIFFMAKKGFVPYSGYLHPVTRGDMFFIHTHNSNFYILIHSLGYFLFASFFYGFAYPLKRILFKRKRGQKKI